MDSFLELEKTLLLLCADLAIIIAAARVFGWLFGKVGQPPVVGEILAGVILGPSLLGRLYPEAIKTLLTPKTSSVRRHQHRGRHGSDLAGGVLLAGGDGSLHDGDHDAHPLPRVSHAGGGGSVEGHGGGL